MVPGLLRLVEFLGFLKLKRNFKKLSPGPPLAATVQVGREDEFSITAEQMLARIWVCMGGQVGWHGRMGGQVGRRRSLIGVRCA